MQVGRLQRQLPDKPQLREELDKIARPLNVQCDETSLTNGAFSGKRSASGFAGFAT
jgi:hypothetical protein